MAGPVKKVTLTGLKIIPNPHAVLEAIHNRMLKLLVQFPEDYTYRKCTEKLIKERMEILRNHPDRTEAEEKLGVKYIEEIIAQARLELGLVIRMKTWKPWENLVEEAPEDQWKWPPHK